MISKYQKEKVSEKEKKAVALYKQGLSLRAVAVVVKMSHEWVRTAVDKLTRLDK